MAERAAPDGAVLTDLTGARETLGWLWAPLLAVTTTHEGRANGQIALAGMPGSILPEAPRVVVGLWKANLTHDLTLASGVLAVHLLPAAPEAALLTALDILTTLGLQSGREQPDKLARLRTRVGVTGAPILLDALSYVEARVSATLDAGEMTLFLGDVVAGERLRPGDPLAWVAARERLTPVDLTRYEAGQRRQRELARRQRGLPSHVTE